MKIGIVGLRASGKTTLLQTLARSYVDDSAAQTGECNHGKGAGCVGGEAGEKSKLSW